MIEPELDDDGYPTDLTLATIKLWPCVDTQSRQDLMNYVHKAWWMPEWGWDEEQTRYESDKEVTRYTISTGGWSGNESLIHALHSNQNFFWTFCWVEARRGGHYIFEVA